ncbi:unnamed protein product [Absidia cylindrospora]
MAYSSSHLSSHSKYLIPPFALIYHPFTYILIDTPTRHDIGTVVNYICRYTWKYIDSSVERYFEMNRLNAK